MCSKEDTAEILHQEFWKEDGLKDQLIKEVQRAIDARVGRWLIGGGIVIVFTIAAAWFSLKNEVTRNTEYRENGFNKDQAALLIQRLDQMADNNRDLNRTIKELDDRLRAKGI